MVKSKYIPHQGKREKARIRKRLGLPEPIQQPIQLCPSVWDGKTHHNPEEERKAREDKPVDEMKHGCCYKCGQDWGNHEPNKCVDKPLEPVPEKKSWWNKLVQKKDRK